MRTLGFSQKWPKLQQKEFTTFRFPRKDKDWQEGEWVRIVLKPRSPKRQILGVAEIVGKIPRYLPEVTEKEAQEDGFQSLKAMQDWMEKQYGHRFHSINKLTLRWFKVLDACD